MIKKAIVGYLLSSLVVSVFAAPSSDKIYPIPFPQLQGKKEVRKFTPEIKGNNIIYGNRIFEINENGKWRLLIGGNEIFTISNSFFLKENGHFVSTTRCKEFKAQPMVFKDNTFKFSGIFKLKSDGSRTAQYTQQARLLADGLLEIEMRIVRNREDSELIYDESIFLSAPLKIAQNCSCNYISGEKNTQFSISASPDGKRKLFFSTWSVIDRINIFNDLPEYSFSIIPTSKLFQNCYTAGNTFGLQFRPLKKDERLVRFKIDLRSGATTKTETTYSGLDWKKIENLIVYDRDAGKNLLLNPSFEQGSNTGCRIAYPGFDCSKNKWDRGTAVIDKKVAKFGNHSLKIPSWSKNRRGDWRGIYEAGDISFFPVPAEAGNYIFSCYVKGDNVGQTISLWAAKTCLPKDKKIGGDRWIALSKTQANLSREWQRFVLPVKVPFDMPLVISLNVCSIDGKGNVWIDGMQLERGNVATAFENKVAESALYTSSETNFIEAGKPIKASLKVFAQTPGKARLSVKDFFGNIVYCKNFKFRNGSEIALDDLKTDCGVFVVHTEYELDNGKKTYDFHRFSVMNFMNNTHRLKNVFAVDYLNLCGYANFYAILERCKLIGLGGKGWFYPLYKEIINAYTKHNIDISHAALTERGKNNRSHFWIYMNPTMRRSIDSTPPVLKDYRDENPNGELTADYLKRFTKAVEQRVKTFPWVSCWSFAGEDDAASPMLAGLSASDKEFNKYVELQIAFYNGVKRANPQAKVIGGQIPCNASPRSGILSLERFLKSVNNRVKFDLLAIHTYRFAPEGQEDLDADINQILKIMDKYGYQKKQLYLPEGGYYNLYDIPQWELNLAGWNAINHWLYGPVSYDMGWTEKISSAYYVRSLLSVLKYSDRVSFFTMGLQAAGMFGMDTALTPFSTQKAVSTVAHLLGDSTFKKDIRFAPFVRCYIYEDADKRPIAAVWSHEPGMNAGIVPEMIAAADFGKNVPEIFDIMEAVRIPKLEKDGKICFTVGPFPMFFRGKPGTLAQMTKSFSKAVSVKGSRYPQVEMSMYPVSPTEYDIKLNNTLTQEFKGKLTINGKSQELTLAPKRKSNITQRLPEKLSNKHMTKETITVMVDKLTNKLEFEGIICTYVNGTPDWNKIPKVPFVNKINPVSPEDFSATYQLAWNENNLYIRVNVKDDKFVHKEYSQPEQRWNNDSLQIYFDTLLNARLNKKQGYDSDDYEYAVFPNATGNGSSAWRSIQPDIQLTLGTTAPRNNAFEPEIPTKFTKKSQGYIYEVTFPVKYLLPIQMKKGSAFGFSLFLNDRDDAKNEKIKSHLTLTPNGTCSYNNPRQWPVMLLWDK